MLTLTYYVFYSLGTIFIFQPLFLLIIQYNYNQ